MVPNVCAGGQLGADFRQIDVDDVAELLLGEVGDADGAGVAIDAHPLVVFRVLQIGRIHAFLSIGVPRGGQLLL